MVKLSFLGDIMCEMQQNKASYNKKNGTYDYSSCFKDVKKCFEDTDFLVGNLETPIAGEKFKYTNHIWSFNTPIEFAKAVKDMGVDLVSTANNHCLDRGVQGLENTIEALRNIKLDYIGTCLKKEKNEPYIIEKDGIQIGILSYTYGTNAHFNKIYLNKDQKHMVNIFESQEKEISKYNIGKRFIKKVTRYQIIRNNLTPVINELKKNIDYIIVCMHAGGQHNREIDNYTKEILKILKELGVNLVVGCHPHVVQEGIFEKNFIGTYSLGNFFCTPGTSSSPLDKLSDYSIGLNVYIEKENIVKVRKVTFSIYKTLIDEFKSSKTVLLYDLLKEKEQNKNIQVLLDDNLEIYNLFCNTNYKQLEPQKEYEIKIEG